MLEPVGVVDLALSAVVPSLGDPSATSGQAECLEDARQLLKAEH